MSMTLCHRKLFFFQTGILRINFKNLNLWNTYVESDTIVIENSFNFKLVLMTRPVLSKSNKCIVI